MKTEDRLCKALKTLMATEPLDTITVKRLSQMCGINRQTFYYHYRDIYDLLTSIFLNERVEGLEQCTSIKEVISLLLEYIENNASFITNILNSAGRDLFKEFIYNGLYTNNLKMLNRRDVHNVMSLDDKKFVSTFYAAGLEYSLISWVDSGMKENKDGVVRRVSILIEDYFENTISRFEKA